MRLMPYALLLILLIFTASPHASAQSGMPPKKHLRNAPTQLALNGTKVSLSAQLWYDFMPTIGDAPKKHLLGTLQLRSNGNQLPDLRLCQVWILHHNRLWACKAERQESSSSDNVIEFRLTNTPTLEELPAGSEVIVTVRLCQKHRRARLLRAPLQTVQRVY
ncbi:MAG: hypothetical protein ACK42Y_04250 [Candidatus Thermochlorobacter sp.]